MREKTKRDEMGSKKQEALFQNRDEGNFLIVGGQGSSSFRLEQNNGVFCHVSSQSISPVEKGQFHFIELLEDVGQLRVLLNAEEFYKV